MKAKESAESVFDSGGTEIENDENLSKKKGIATCGGGGSHSSENILQRRNPDTGLVLSVLIIKVILGRHNIDSQIKGRFGNKYSRDNYHRKPTCKLCVNSVMLKFCWNLISVKGVYHILTDKGATIIRMRIIYRPTCCIVIVIVFG